MAEINRVKSDLYEIEPTNTTEYAPVRFYVTAADLLDIMDYALRYAKQLEQERDEAQGTRIPPGHSVSSALDPHGKMKP